MTKKVIAIISVLKPVDDTRNYEKIATSISNKTKYEINIIGFSPKKIPADPNITFHPLFNFHRTSIKRLCAPYAAFKKLIKLKPELIIVTCAELLLVIYFYKIIFGAKIIYDIQENYRRNILYSASYPALIKMPLASAVWCVEWLSRLFVDQYILAEEVYGKQLKFTKNRSVTIDNKAVNVEKSQSPQPVPGSELRLVYSGTISMHYGIFDAINLAILLREHDINVRLLIIGFAADRKLYRLLVNIIRQKDYIRLIGGDALVPHDQILKEIKHAHFCLLSYQKNRSIEGRIPTKLYECLAMEKPVIITPNPAWNDLIDLNNAGIIYDFQSSVDQLIPALYKLFYGKNLSQRYLWSNSEQPLLTMVERLLN